MWRVAHVSFGKVLVMHTGGIVEGEFFHEVDKIPTVAVLLEHS